MGNERNVHADGWEISDGVEPRNDPWQNKGSRKWIENTSRNPLTTGKEMKLIM
jgi:hypothetical protein